MDAEDRDSCQEGGVRAALLLWKSWRIERVCLSTLDAESSTAVQAVDMGLWVVDLMTLLTGYRMPMDVRSDCMSLISALGTDNSLENKHTEAQVLSIRQDLTMSNIRSVKHVPHDLNYSDALTKPKPDVPWEVFHAMMVEGRIRHLN